MGGEERIGARPENLTELSPAEPSKRSQSVHVIVQANKPNIPYLPQHIRFEGLHLYPSGKQLNRHLLMVRARATSSSNDRSKRSSAKDSRLLT